MSNSSSSPVAALLHGITHGERLALARAITLIEGESPHAAPLIASIYPNTGKAHIVGITGAPGSGKSTLVTAMAQAYRARGQTVGIVAIDPTSPFTGGALLGDRVRMRALTGDAGVFVRSMATRGSLGGLSKTTAEVVLLLDAAGFDRILVETVGVGQAEVEIASTAHSTIVVEAPGMGDEVQAIKAGILEIADLLVVNKADRPGVDRTVRALEMMLELEGSHPRVLRHHGTLMQVAPVAAQSTSANHDGHGKDTPLWKVEVLKTVAAGGNGVPELLDRLEAHRVWLVESGQWQVREGVRVAHMVENIVRATLLRRLLDAIPAGQAADMVRAVQAKEIDPYTAASQLLGSLPG